MTGTLPSSILNVDQPQRLPLALQRLRDKTFNQSLLNRHKAAARQCRLMAGTVNLIAYAKAAPIEDEREGHLFPISADELLGTNPTSPNPEGRINTISSHEICTRTPAGL